MKLAISNIAWPKDQDPAVADLLGKLGVTGIEVAPTKIWPDLLAVVEKGVAATRSFWESRGIAIVAAQSLLFGRAELTLFENATVRTRTLDYLERVIRICGQLGAKSLVFGSPKNRRIGTLAIDEARQIAVDFFGRLGEMAEAHGTIIVLEANPPDYGADFITRAGEAIELVQAVDHPGFRLHLDSACMTMAEDPVVETLDAGRLWLRHFHVSEPGLEPIGSSKVPHHKFSEVLRQQQYPHWVSIEMKETAPFTLAGLENAITQVQSLYHPDGSSRLGG